MKSLSTSHSSAKSTPNISECKLMSSETGTCFHCNLLFKIAMVTHRTYFTHTFSPPSVGDTRVLPATSTKECNKNKRSTSGRCDTHSHLLIKSSAWRVLQNVNTTLILLLNFLFLWDCRKLAAVRGSCAG